ncbi:hypothetical protein CYMTET_45105 [Cymbomonas tetramitiformis]|uniref:Uncharacterized protein n=1 Tax=Cymbomonas tetramitiformis TaxID=36881 RepID=A0AAE0EYC6_9CHLO|nr:hypothetical protein CYMTET_45105 [Cymbomonas tetramitiformis]
MILLYDDASIRRVVYLTKALHHQLEMAAKMTPDLVDKPRSGGPFTYMGGAEEVRVPVCNRSAATGTWSAGTWQWITRPLKRLYRLDFKTLQDSFKLQMADSSNTHLIPPLVYARDPGVDHFMDHWTNLYGRIEGAQRGQVEVGMFHDIVRKKPWDLLRETFKPPFDKVLHTDAEYRLDTEVGPLHLQRLYSDSSHRHKLCRLLKEDWRTEVDEERRKRKGGGSVPKMWPAQDSQVARQHPIHEYPILTHPDLGIIVAEPLPVTDTRDDDPNIEWTAEANQGLHYIPLKALETAEQARLLAYFTDHETGAFTPMDMIVQGRPKPSHTRLRRMGLEAATYIEAAGPSVATIPQSL